LRGEVVALAAAIARFCFRSVLSELATGFAEVLNVVTGFTSDVLCVAGFDVTPGLVVPSRSALLLDCAKAAPANNISDIKNSFFNEL
jgi:hypothetical protein